MDAAHGIVYRPLLGPSGIGGTRYFPLEFMLHSILIRCGLPPITSGFIILLGSAALLLCSAFALMRKLNVPVAVARPLCALITCTESAAMALTMIRGDLLAAGLNVAALSICVGMLTSPSDMERRRTLWMVVAGVIFGLTFLAKVTSIFGFATAVVALLWQGRKQLVPLLAVLLGFGAVTVAGLVAVQVVSHGNFYANLRACASAGGVMGPLTHLPQILSKMAVDRDPLGFAIFAIGAAVCCSFAGRKMFDLVPLAFVFTAAATLLIFATPGIDRNHLLDVQVISLVMAGVTISRGGDAARLLTGGLIVVALASLGSIWLGLKDDLPRREQQYLALAKDATAGQTGPLLSDFALFPVLLDQRPYLLDDYMLPVICRSHPEIHNDLYEKLDHGFFSAVILKVNPQRDNRLAVWGPTFVQHLQLRYGEGESHANFLVYRRKDVSGK